jgi:Kef-type K+ transport system membrane component KefB
VSFGNLAIVAVIAVAAPLLVTLVPAVRVPPLALEISAGYVLGPNGLGWIELDTSVRVLSDLGVVALLFLAGLEVEPSSLRGRAFRSSLGAFAMSLVIGFTAGYSLKAADLVTAPFLVSLMLASTSLGVVLVALKDAREVTTPFGELVIGDASIAEFGTVLLLSLLFSNQTPGNGAEALHLALFGGALVLILVSLVRTQHHERLTNALVALARPTTQISARIAFLLIVAAAWVALDLGFEAVLGAFAAGIIVRFVEYDRRVITEKVETIGFGVLIPVFFVATGMRMDLGATFERWQTIVLVPIAFVAMLVARGGPALLRRRVLGARAAMAYALLEATNVTFVIVATTIGLTIGKLDRATATAFVAAGLLTVVIFPNLALAILREEREAREEPGLLAVTPP